MSTDVKVLHDLKETALADVPVIAELAPIQIRGLPPSSRVRVGLAETVTSPNGFAVINRPSYSPIRGFVGVVPVEVDDERIGEIEIVPVKIDREEFATLLADLRATWGDLVLDLVGGRLDALGDSSERRHHNLSAREVLAVIDAPIRSILRDPQQRFELERVPARLENVRSAFGLTPSVLRNSLVGLPGWSRRLVRKPDPDALAVVADTLRRLQAKATLEADLQTAERCRRLAQHRLLHRVPPQGGSLSWVMRSDARYRRVVEVHRALRDPRSVRLLGPAAASAGVRAMPDLYEYWVFLQTLLAIESMFGPALNGYSQLASPLRDGRFRLEIQPGATVRFPSDVSVVYVPEFDLHSGWHGIRNVAHPGRFRSRGQTTVTPDVVVLREGRDPRAVVIDAKYVGESHLDEKAIDLRDRYGRLARHGQPIVRSVIVAHPHERTELWAGCGLVGLSPGRTDSLANCLAEFLGRAPIRAPVEVSPPINKDNDRVVLLLDQKWSRDALGGTRVDLSAVKAGAAAERDIAVAIIVMPELPLLAGFARAAEGAGWRVAYTSSKERANTVRALRSLVGHVTARGWRAVVISDAPEVRKAVEAAGLDAEWRPDLLFSLGDSDKTGDRLSSTVTAPTEGAAGTRFFSHAVRRQTAATLKEEEWEFLERFVSSVPEGRSFSDLELFEAALREISVGGLYRSALLSGGAPLAFVGQLLRALRDLGLPMTEGSRPVKERVERVLSEMDQEGRSLEFPLEVGYPRGATSPVIAFLGQYDLVDHDATSPR